MSLIYRPLRNVKESHIMVLKDLIKKSFPSYSSLCWKTSKSVLLIRKCDASLPGKTKVISESTVCGFTTKFNYIPMLSVSTNTSDISGRLKFTDPPSVEEIFYKYPAKVKELSDNLEISPSRCASLFVKYKFLKCSKMSTINEKVNYLLGKGISKEELIDDFWILTYNIPTLEKRFGVLTDLNLSPVKPWLLRCSDSMLHRMSKNRESNRLAMGPYKTVADYLKERLGVSDAQLCYFASRYPSVMRVKVAKLKEIIDFLYSEGFSSYQIYQTPRILCHSLVTIQMRLKELRSLNFEPHSLALLCKTKRSFQKIVLNIEKDCKS